jgi:hypothetical protein
MGSKSAPRNPTWKRPSDAEHDAFEGRFIFRVKLGAVLDEADLAEDFVQHRPSAHGVARQRGLQIHDEALVSHENVWRCFRWIGPCSGVLSDLGALSFASDETRLQGGRNADHGDRLHQITDLAIQLRDARCGAFLTLCSFRCRTGKELADKTLDVGALRATQSFNRYAYVYNNPLTLTDPSGYEPPACTPSPTGLNCVGSRGYSGSTWTFYITNTAAAIRAGARTYAQPLIGPALRTIGGILAAAPSTVAGGALALIYTPTQDCDPKCGYRDAILNEAKDAGKTDGHNAEGSLAAAGADSPEAKPPEPKPQSAKPRPEGVPENWVEVPSRDGKGTKWVDPSNPKGGDYVRERADGTLTQVKNGRALDQNGNPASGLSSPEAHFPRDQWKFRP